MHRIKTNNNNNRYSMDKITNVPKNFFVKEIRDVFDGELEEDHRYEQFFWTKNVVDKLVKACEYQFVEETCCLTTPSLAHAFHEADRDETLLDIDTRFSYLPKYKYYDVRSPTKLDESFKLLILDPPFFVVPIEKFKVAVDLLTNNDYSTKIIIGFLKREEKRFLEAFADYNVKLTNFKLEYASIKPNKWSNFGLYSNVDLIGMKRL